MGCLKFEATLDLEPGIGILADVSSMHTIARSSDTYTDRDGYIPVRGLTGAGAFAPGVSSIEASSAVRRSLCIPIATTPPPASCLLFDMHQFKPICRVHTYSSRYPRTRTIAIVNIITNCLCKLEPKVLCDFHPRVTRTFAVPIHACGPSKEPNSTLERKNWQSWGRRVSV